MAVRIVRWDGKVHLGGINAALGFGRPRKMASVTWGYYMHTLGLGSDAGALILNWQMHCPRAV